ncbi:hypothetical protein [Flavobacterium sp.]|uniref:hypothetical protein n=1 Tax=Flavobacterium sp. TaxID=239 RepID=UPI002B4B665E|nr:hypothetical protein [Flavobacterium sp.]HLF53394.1 hypothetical protein [Flavobacterium sp.]
MTETNFKDLWQSQNTNANLNSKDIISKAEQLQKKTRIKLLLTNGLLFVTMLFIIGIVLYFKPEMITTKIGVVLVIIAIVMQIVASSKLTSVSDKNNAQTSNAEYLQQLLMFKKKQVFLQSTIMTAYFILLGLGIVLYMIEYTIRMSVLGAALAYGITGLWMALNWFYFRPKIIKKQQQKLNDIIADLEKINDQFLEEK